jgi:hypothetical protein
MSFYGFYHSHPGGNDLPLGAVDRFNLELPQKT